VHNIKHVGECSAQLVNRIRDASGVDIHVIGFSLGAQVTNYIANSLKPDYVLPRITGLDPALPLFVTSDKAHKLDASDALFVDVFHCNVSSNLSCLNVIKTGCFTVVLNIPF
jgi:pancreatic lipase-related protein 2